MSNRHERRRAQALGKTAKWEKRFEQPAPPVGELTADQREQLRKMEWRWLYEVLWIDASAAYLEGEALQTALKLHGQAMIAARQQWLDVLLSYGREPARVGVTLDYEMRLDALAQAETDGGAALRAIALKSNGLILPVYEMVVHQREEAEHARKETSTSAAAKERQRLRDLAIAELREARKERPKWDKLPIRNHYVSSREVLIAADLYPGDRAVFEHIKSAADSTVKGWDF